MPAPQKWSRIKKLKFRKEKLEAMDRKVKAELFDMNLRALRELLDITQEELAAIADITQPEVSRLERREDHKLSTLRKIVEALGGNLEVVAKFGDKKVRLR